MMPPKDDHDVDNASATSSTSDSDDSLTFSARWTRAINRLHEPFLEHFLHPLTQFAARNPKRTMSAVTLFSFAVVVLGLFTNFNVEVDGDQLWTPKGVRTVEHRDWIADPNQSGYPLLPRSFNVFLHGDGETILTLDAVSGLFEALDAVRNLPEYDNVCQKSPATSVDPVTGQVTCEIIGAVKFWNNSATVFESNATEENIVETLSQTQYPDQSPVSENDIFGFPERDSTTGLLTNAVSMSMVIELPETEDGKEFENDALDAILDLADAWDGRADFPYKLEVMAIRSIDDEIDAAIVADIPLVPIVFTVMGIFTGAIFTRARDPVKSRGFLGFTAVVSVFFSIMSGYGIMFICGINFTSMTQLLPFVVFGIGLDDAFVIMGAYLRTEPSLGPLERIYETMEEVGPSITLTTLTSTLAFGLGCLASIPAVYWLCLYAVPTIVFVYLYQLTFFVAAIVLDENRIAQDRRDKCNCYASKKSRQSDIDQDTSDPDERQNDTPTSQNIIERFIEWYAGILLQPAVKAVVILAFTALLALCAWSASQLTQAFDVADVLPSDSYVTDFLDARDLYTARSPVAPYAYFRYADQSIPEVQEQMQTYVEELIQIDSIPNPPPFFWLVDFQFFVDENPSTIGLLPFHEQMDAFLEVDEYKILYEPHIVRDAETGAVLSSRVRLFMDNVEVGDVNIEVEALEQQQDVTDRQPVNQAADDYPFFLYDSIFQIWEFYATSVDELILTTILGVVSVTVVALLFIPHWTAALFVLPMISILYVDLLGVMQWGGVSIDPVSYVTCVMSIGLLVDFIIHVLLRYYECPGNRHEKTVAMLKSMGVSILTGGISTFLGTLPLVFSTSTIFSTIFIAFLGLSTLGVGHGLILLPVILSMIGPEDQISRSKKSIADEEPAKKVLEPQETVETKACEPQEVPRADAD